VAVPVADPSRAVRALRGELDAAVSRVLDSGRYVLGPEHDRFESELAEYLGASHCVGVASGTDALEIALVAVGCGEGDEIVTAANAGYYSTAAALAAGLRVRYADVDATTLTVSAATVEAALTPETRAVVVTHLYGLLAPVEPIVEFCRARGVVLVEDCAQAAGARREGRLAGTFGDVATFSFYPTKNLAALGDGGAVVTGDAGVAERARRLRQYGWEAKYTVATAGGRNSRLDELQAAVLRVRLPQLDAWNARRRDIAASYAEALPSSAGRLVSLPGEDYVAHLAVALVEERDAARERLAAAGVGTDVHYPVPDHRQPVWGSAYAESELPVTEHAAGHVVTLPCFPELTDNEVDRVCEALDEL
jgi:dTDP-3-amino-2,3,6-trideoxy-4-keto-D-glucose/dTDP-3-amino-3,4,6-trideoxy-alpha-D-glucose/dTDP-2,6-dideoxy-D-kanosamine transaminase